MAGVRTATLDGLLGAPAGLTDSEAREMAPPTAVHSSGCRRCHRRTGGARVVVYRVVALRLDGRCLCRCVRRGDHAADRRLVLSVPVNDTQTVKRGQVLVVIDPVDQQIAVAQAEANYGQATRRVEQYFANAGAGAAQVASKRADLQRAQLDYKRRVALASTGAVSGDELSTAKDALETAAAGLEEAQRQLTSQQALIRGTTVQNNPEVLAAKAPLDTARLALSRTVMRAPFDGIVAQNKSRSVSACRSAHSSMTVVPISQVYVDANFKEGQLRKVRSGQPATLTSDLYGSGRRNFTARRGPRRRHRFGLCRDSGAERDRQLDQGGAAPAGAHRARSEGTREHPLRVGLSMTARSTSRMSPRASMANGPTRKPSRPGDRYSGSEAAVTIGVLALAISWPFSTSRSSMSRCHILQGPLPCRPMKAPG